MKAFMALRHSVAMALLGAACRQEPSPDTESDDSDTSETGGAWWEDVPDLQFSARAVGFGQDQPYDWNGGGGDTECTHYADPDRVEFNTSDGLGQGGGFWLCQYDGADRSMTGGNYFTAFSPNDCDEPGFIWAGVWRWYTDTTDLGSKRTVYSAPFTPDEQADCTLDAHTDGNELVIRFACPWYREQNGNDEETLSLTGTGRCAVEEADSGN